MNTKIDGKIMGLVENYKTVTYIYKYNIKKNKKGKGESIYLLW